MLQLRTNTFFSGRDSPKENKSGAYWLLWCVGVDGSDTLSDTTLEKHATQSKAADLACNLNKTAGKGQNPNPTAILVGFPRISPPP
jgi:hypothetical protein